MSAPYDFEPFLVKTRLFLNRAMDDDGRSFDEQALWATLGLELLGKAVLAKKSPALIADIQEEGHHLMVALGLTKVGDRNTTIAAKTVFMRCKKMISSLDDKEAMTFIHARNAFLHGGTAHMTLLHAHVWWSKFWPLVEVLTHELDLIIDDLVGADRVTVVQDHLDFNKKSLQTRYDSLVARAERRLAEHAAGTLPERIAKQWRPGISQDMSMKYRNFEQTCPACGKTGTLESDNIDDVDADWSGDPENPDLVVTLTVTPEFFSCDNCGLQLDGISLLDLAGMADQFYAQGDESDIQYEPDYGND